MAELHTPLHDWHVAHKARMVPFAGWSMPVQYGGIIEEHQAVRQSAGWFDVSHMGRFLFEGPGAPDLIQHVWTNNAATMKVGQVRYGLICNDLGGILDDVLVYRLDGRWMMVVNAGNREKIWEWLAARQAPYEVTLSDRTADWAMIAVQGPKALNFIEPLFGSQSAALRYYFATTAPFTGNPYEPILISRTGYTGEDGCEVILPAEHSPALADALSGSAKPCGLGARDTLRLEAAMPLYGHELTEDIDPYQAGLSWAVKPEKGSFIGRDSLLKLLRDPSRPKRVGLELEGRRAAREGCAVFAGERCVGTVTSGSFGPTLDKSIAMAYLEPAAADEGRACEVEVRGSRVAARVVALPFYQRK